MKTQDFLTKINKALEALNGMKYESSFYLYERIDQIVTPLLTKGMILRDWRISMEPNISDELFRLERDVIEDKRTVYKSKGKIIKIFFKPHVAGDTIEEMVKNVERNLLQKNIAHCEKEIAELEPELIKYKQYLVKAKELLAKMK